jgi:hypothetical protein
MAGFQFPAEAINFSLLHIVLTYSGTHPASYLLSNGAFSAEIKRQEREADCLPPSSVEVKNRGTILPLPRTSSWNSA